MKRMSGSSLRSTLAAALLAVPASAQLPSFAHYWPLELGHSWRFVDAPNPAGSFVFDALARTQACGQESLLVGPDIANALIVREDDVAFTWLGSIEAGSATTICPGVQTGVVSDGISYSIEP